MIRKIGLIGEQGGWGRPVFAMKKKERGNRRRQRIKMKRKENVGK